MKEKKKSAKEKRDLMTEKRNRYEWISERNEGEESEGLIDGKHKEGVEKKKEAWVITKKIKSALVQAKNEIRIRNRRSIEI